ncbi:autotransporter-associated beta strand repeat-containing protein [Brevifollis gellanilyticus]|uniref:Autotransporter domain-containing protein n=1 Tax=Brevifollis gellanilyticus TaxID=748831 RepID=A0A512MF20_9BACT|nr:autotransporter-associated beta strand repeat-containing protein [Brevifollis gellanilyticus]GEP44951.1 hypothetical protein BGE01nite_42420 [Brevifollis gellanilyticus]
MKNSHPTNSIPERLTRTLRQPLWKKMVSSVLLAQLALWSVQVRGADFTWDGNAGNWNTSSPQWNGGGLWTNGNNNIAIFGGTPGTVTLTEAITAGGLIFNTTGYTLASNVLTLGGIGEIKVTELGDRATISSQISGTSGLYKTGNGVLVLSNNSNNYSGTTLVNQGGLVVTNQLQLGNSNLIAVNGYGAAGYSGGQLILQGGLGSMTFNKNLALAGRALNYANSSTAALVNIGYNNTISSNFAFANGSAANVANNYGNLTLSGTLGIPTGNSFATVGNGNFIVSGLVTGGNVSTDRFIKSGTNIGTTLWLQNPNNNYVSDTRIDSGTIRVSTNSALGLSTSTTAIDLVGGTLEINTDTPDFSTRNIRFRDNNTGGIFVNRALGGSGLNQTVTFGRAIANLGVTFNLSGRDGYNTTMGDGVNTFSGGGANGVTINNNSSGLLTINAPTMWSQGDGTTRTFAIQGNADSLLSGNFLRTGGGAHIFTKGGTGTVTLQGTAGTFTGSANVTGTAIINSYGVFNTTTASGAVQLNAGAVSYLGTSGTGAGETLTKVINLSGTTGAGVLLGNQAGTAPTALVVSSNVAAGGAGLKTLFLGGSAGAAIVNTVNGVIQNNTTANPTNLAKIGSGTWLYSPAAANYAAGGAINSGAAASATNTGVIPMSSTTGLVLGQSVTGTNVPGGSVITAITPGVSITINNNISTAVAAATSLTFGAVTNFTGNVTVSGGLLQVKPSAGSGNGLDVINNGSAVGFAPDALNLNNWAGGVLEYQGFSTGSTEQVGPLNLVAGQGTIKVTPGASGSTILNFASLGSSIATTAASSASSTITVASTAGLSVGMVLGGGSAAATITSITNGTQFVVSAAQTISSGATLTFSRPTGSTVNFAPGTGTGIQFATPPTGVNGIIGGFAYITDPVSEAIDFAATPAANTNITALGSSTAFPTATGSATTNYLLNANTTTTGAVAANSIRFADGASLTLGTGNLTITSTGTTAVGGILHDNANGASVISGQNILVSAANQELAIITGGKGAAANTLTISSVITGNNTTTAGTGGVTKAGTGTLILSGANTYTGTTTINEGTVRLGNANGLGGTNAGLMMRQGTTLDLNGFSVGSAGASSGLNAFNGAGIITNSAASGTALLRFGNNNTGGLFTGLITDGATAKIALVKAGTGTSVLSAANTFTGPVTILGGNLDLPNIANIGVASGIGAGDATDATSNAASLVFNGGNLRYVGTNSGGAVTATQTPSVSTNRLFTLAGSGGIYSFGSYGNITAARAGNNAALIFNNTADLAFSGAGVRTFTLGGDSTGDNEIRIRLRDNPNANEALSLTKADAGLWILNPLTSNTYSGATTISGGALQVAPQGAAVQGFSANSNLVLSGGVIQTSGSFTKTMGTGANQVQLTGGGFSASDSKLTVNLGGGTINLGTAPTAGSTIILSSTSAFADVELQNAINLGTAARTIQVDDNGNTGLDFAYVSGVISGGTGGTLNKTGSGTLIVGAANTYVGGTTITAGNLFVQSVGAAGDTATSLGTNVGGGALTLAGGQLFYVGTGEQTTRSISLTASATIDAGGSGPLVLTNFSNGNTTAKTLTIRGISIDGNTITSNLLDNTGALSVTKADGGVWELTGNNTFTGNLSINGGLIGVNAASGLGAPGTGAIVVSNGGIYSTNASSTLTIARALQIASNTQVAFTGSNPISVSSTITGNTGNPWTINNTITNPAGLTISGAFNSAETSTTRTLAITGTGNTTVSGILQGAGGGGGTVGLVINTASSATTTLTGGSPNLLAGSGELRQGILVLDKAGALGTAQTFDLNGGELRATATVGSGTFAGTARVNGSTAIVNGSNPITFSGSLGQLGGNRTLQNDITAGTGLTISGPVNLSVDATITARTLTLSGIGTTNISGIIRNDAAAGSTASNVTYSGTGALNLNGAAANSWTGTAIFQGGTTTVSNGATIGTTGAATVSQAILTLDNVGTNVLNRLGNRALTLNGATLNLTGNTAGTAEANTSGLTIGSGGSTINITNNGGTSSLSFSTLTMTAAGAALDVTGGVGTATTKLLFTTAPTLLPATTGILPRVTVSGSDFATYGANGIAAFTGYVTPANINSAGTTDTLKLDGTTTVGALTASRTINALAFDTGAPTVSNGGSSNGSVLTITSGGLLVKAGTQTLAARTALGAEGQFHVASGTTLNVTGILTGTAGLTKNLPGAMNITTPQFYAGTTTLNGGTTTLSTSNNTLFLNQTLVVNPGATLDLNGGNQVVGAFGGGNIPGSGGTITSAAAAVFSNNGNVAYGGGITGAITMNKFGGNTLTAESPLAYTGETWVTGGTLTLRDNATLLNTSAINVNFATLNLDSNASLQMANNNRVNDAAPITLRGGTITYQARFGVGSETLGAISLVEGASTINVNAANNAGSNLFNLAADLTIASLTRAAGTTANFTVNQGFGTSGNNNHLYITSTPTTLSNGMLGAWAIANATDFATYDPITGMGAFGYALARGYDTTFAPGNVTQFINNAAPTSQPISANTTTGALRLGGVSNNDITFASGSTMLTLETGGLLRSNQAAATTIGSFATRGVLTAGTTASPAELVIYSANTTATALAATGSTTAGSPVVTVPSNAVFSPGMTITGTNIPAGSYVVSVDSATQVTISQNATATGGSIAFTPGTANVIVHSVITNNAAGGAVTLVKSGAGTLNLSGNNTYTGGTIFNQGTVNLVGSGVVIPTGGVTLSGATLTMNTNAGQIAAGNSVTLNDSSTLNLVGNNSLVSLNFNNTGGTGTPTVNTGGSLTLTGATPVTVTSNNLGSVPTIAGTVTLSGTKTFNIGAIQVGSEVLSRISPSMNISAVINSTGSTTLVKTGAGLLQLSGANTFYGSLDLQNGGLLVGTSSAPTQGGAGLTSGPFGNASITAAAGTYFVTDASRSFGNNVAFAGTPIFDSTASTVWTLTLNGTLTGAGLAGPTPTIQVDNPFLTVALLGKIPNIGSITSFNKTGPGTLIFNATGYTGDFNASALGNQNQVQLLHDGDGTGSVQNIALPGNVIFDAGIVPNIVVNRAGGAIPFPTPANKIITPASISNIGTGLTVTNTNGYGLGYAGAVAFGSSPVFNVVNATNSNVTQGLYLSGNLTGTGFTKSGAGTMVINNATPANNTFTGNINITQGVVSVNADAQLGNAANLVVLNPSTGTSTLRATDTFTLNHTIQFAGTANTRTIEVSNGKTLTIGSAFDLNSGAGNAAVLTKADMGTLALNVNNPSWTGGINITQGAVLLDNNTLTNAAGTGTISVAPAAAAIGAALQLAGGVTISNPLNLQGTANQLYAGINFGGQLENVSGTNTYSGGIAMPFDATIGARTGSTLNITGLITATGSHRLQFNAEGNINVTGGETGILFGFDKYGAGTLTINTAAFGGVMTTGGVQVHRGTLVLNGAGTTNSAGAVNIVQSGATMRLDNSGTNTASRLTGRALTLQGGNFDFIANNSTELAGALIYDQGGNTINNGGSGTSSLTFASFAGAAGGTLNVTGTFGTATNFVKSTAAVTLTPATTGILNRVTVNGNELASYNATNGIVAFTGYSVATNILSATTTSTFKATPSTLNSLTGNATLNALTLNGTAAVGGLGGNPPSALTLTSGTILANGTGGAFLNVPIVTFAANEAIIHVQSGQTLTVNSGMNGSGGLSKNLTGNLIFNAPQFVSGTTYVNAGMLTLSGGNNTMLFNNGVAVNNGGTLELNGNSQFMAGLSSAAAGTGVGVVGGTVTNSSGTQSTLTINGNTNFGGVIAGNIFLNKTGTGSLNLQQPQTYTGPTLITGGSVTLSDFATLPNTNQPIEIRYGALNLTNNGTSFADHGNRVSDTAPITLVGGAIAITGRQASLSSETLGSITLAGGQNILTTSAGGTNINSIDVTIASLARTDNTSTIRFNATGALGSSNRLFITANPTLTNNIIGAWAISDREFASYDVNYGVGRLNDTGYAGYAGNGLNSNPLATDNVRFTNAGTTTLLGNTTANTLAFASQSTATVLNLGGNTLILQGGGLLMAQGTDNIDHSITNGNLTSGTLNNPSDFFIHHANLGGAGRTVTIGAAITNNGTGAVRTIFGSGQLGETVATGAVTLNGTNTYTGGTVINSGAITLGATGTLGSGGLTVKNGIFTQTAGGVIPSQALTLGGGASVTLAGNNSLTTLTIDNNGGSAPTVNPTGILTLTGAGGITVTTSSPGTIATIGTGTLDLNANATYPISIGAAVVNGVDTAPWQAGFNISALLQNGGIVKSGPGLLQLSNASSTFAGGVNVSAGGLVIGASSIGANLGDALISGPLGTGTVTMAANTTLVSTGAFAVTNDFVFQGNTTFNGTNNLTLNGNTILPSTWNATVTAPQTIVTIGNVINSLASDVINKGGLGTLNVGNYNGTINIAGGLIFSADGNQLGTPQSLALGGNLNLTADTAITVNRSGGAPNARNKTLQKVNLINNGSILAVNNLNGYGLEFTGTTSLTTGASHFSVTNASASNVVAGLTLSGVVSDTSGFSMVKSGLGTLAFTNSGNTFGGVGATIDVLNGVLAADSDGALGNSANTITLDGDGALGTAFRATGTFTTGRTFILNTVNNAFEVTVGNVLSLTAPFSLSAPTNTLIKNDNGVLAINANNSTMTGAVTINAGAIRALNNSALGSGTITIANATGAALQLSGGVTVSNPFTLTATSTGINNGGIIESVSGVNTYSGAITQTSGAAATYGAQSGSTLNLTGTYNAPGANSITFAGAGTVNLQTALNNGGTFNKLGNGILNINVANPALAASQTVNLFGGTTTLAGPGTLGPVGAATGTLTVDVGATLTLDNRTAALGGTGINVNDRFGTTRNITFRGGNFNLVGNETVNTTETFATPTMARGLSVITVTAQTGAQANLLFTTSSQSTGFAAAQNNGTGPTGTSVLFRGTNLGQAAANGVATVRNSGSTNGFQFNGQGGANGSNTKGILPWALIDSSATGSGTSFATGDGTAFTTAILRPLAAGEYGTANTITANQNVLLNSGATTNISATIAPNSLTIDASANTGSTNPFAQLSLSSGGILVRSGSTSTIGGAVINQPAGNSPLNIWTVGDLSITSSLIGGNGTANGAVGFVKAGAGTLTLSTPTTTTTGLAALTGLSTGINNYSGQLVINQGTLKLNGGTNTIQANNFMAINGGTLDLNGNTQQILSLFTDGTVSGAGGIITSSTGTGNFVVNQDATNRNWAGSIQDSVNFVRSGQAILTIYSPQTYTGTTVINGGATTLRDDASFSGTSGIDINFASLTLDNNTSTTDLSNRIRDAAAITLRGGTLAFQGRVQTASSEQVGVVTLAQGNSFLNSTVGGTGINSADLMLAGLNRTTGGGTVNFTAATGGQIGSSARIMISEINGVSTATLGGGLVNEIIGGWAVIGTSDFATYVPGLGVAAMGATGALQYSNPTSVPSTIATAATTDNVSINAPVTGNILSVPNDQMINSLRVGNIATQTVNIAAGKTLTLSSGGLLFFSTAQQNIGSAVNQGSLTSGGPELFVYSQGTGPHVINSVITGSGMTLIKSGANTVTLAGTNTYTGGTVVNQGVLNVATTSLIPLATIPANGLVISGGTATMNAAGAIAAGNIVTLNGGGSVLNLFGDNTITGLVFNNIGGGASNVQINTFAQPATGGSGATGVLTIGSDGIVATSANVTNSNIIVGRVDFGTTMKTLNIAPITVNGVQPAPLLASLALQSIVGSTGGINKTGNGVLQFNAQAHYSGPTQVTTGGIRTGVTNGGSRLSALTLGAGTHFNLNGLATTWGSLAGSGTVFNSSTTAATVTFGFDNTSTTFSGQIARFSDAVVGSTALQKIGTGVMSMTSAQSFATGSTGAITINGGELNYTGAGKAFAGTAQSGGGTFNVNVGGTLRVNNSLASASNVNNRLGLNVAGTLNLQGGSLIIDGNGNDASNTVEVITTLDFTNGGGVITLNANAGSQLNLTVTTLAAEDGTGSGLIRGIGGTAAAAGNATLTITTPSLLGSQGTGATGTSTMAVRRDILADASATGVGTGFLVRDTVTGLYRALGGAAGLASTEYNLTQATWASTQNAGINAATTALPANRAANTLTIGGASTLSSALDSTTFGSYGPNGGLLALSLTINAALALDGSVADVNIGTLNGTAGTAWAIHTVGTAVMNLNGRFGLNNTAGILKAGAGTLNFNNQTLFTGTLAVNDGTVNLNSGAENTLVVTPTTGAAATNSLNVNGIGAVVDLKGNNQAVNVLLAVNPLPGNGGTVTNSSVTAATLTSIGGGTFSGQISGNLAFTRAGNNTTTLTTASTYTGVTVVRGGTLQLRDSGSIASTAGLSLNYGTLNWDNFGLNPNGNPNPVRIAANNPVTMLGSSFNINGAGSTDTTVALNSIAVTGGNNTINVLPYINEGSTVKLTIGALTRDNTNHSGINFNGFTTNNSSGVSTIGGQGLTQNGQVVINSIGQTVASAVTTAGSNIVTVPSTAGLYVGGLVTGTGLPANSRITAITSATTFTITTGTGVTAQSSTTLTASSPIINLSLTGGVTTAGSNIVTVPSTTGLFVGAPVTGTGIPANSFITGITGATTFTITTGTGVTAQSATTLTFNNLQNNLIGGWAVADGNTFATYVSGNGVFTNNGVSVMSQTTQGIVAPGFTGTDLSAALVTTGNYSDGGTTRTLAAGAQTANSIRLVPGAAQTITMPTTSTLALNVGMISNAAFLSTIAATDATNTISGTGTDLYFFVNQNVLQINAAIIGSAALVSNGPATLRLAPAFASNTYTGGTFVQNGTMTLQATSPFIAIPGNLTINNAAVTMSTTPNQIATTSVVSINGGGSLTLANYTTGPTQTLDSVIFSNEGGIGNPTLSLGTPTTATSTLVLSSATPITASNNSLATVPTISTGAATLTALQFSNANPVIMVNQGLGLTGLTIIAPITQNAGMTGAISKSGLGALALSGQSTFTTGLTLNQGSLILGANSTPTTVATPVTSGPLGTGTLTIAGGTTLLSDGTARTVSNPITVSGDFTVGGIVAGNGVVLNGTVDLGATGRTITVTSPAVNATLAGVISSTATGTALTKAGAGTLTLSNSSNVLGGAGIAVTGGILKLGVDNAIPNASPLAISAGAGFDLNAFNEAIQTISGTGFITNSGVAKTLTVGGTSATDTTTPNTVNSTFAGAIVAATPANLLLTKSGLGNLTLTGSGLSTYAGATTVVAGSLIGGADNAFSPNSIVTVGNTTTGTANLVATLDTGAFNQTIAGLVAATQTVGSSSTINVASGKTLTVNGNVTLGSNTSATDTTNVNFTGGGNLVVSATAGTFQVGGATGGTNTNAAIVNMSALASFTANLGSGGTFRIGDAANTTAVSTFGSSILTLAPVSSIAAGTLNIGESTAQNIVQTLKLGSTSNALNFNTINVGANTNRGIGNLSFATGTGTVTVRAFDGVSRAVMNLTNGSGATANPLASTVDLSGHNADLLLSTLTLAARSGGTTGGATSTFTFDTGTLDVTSTVMTSRTGATLTTGALASTINLGGGTASLGAVTMAINSVSIASTGAATATLNISGGSVTAASINMANAGNTGGTKVSTSTINITGGTLTMGGNITRTGGAGTENTTLTLNGGTLDMAGFNIGSATLIGSGSGSLNFQSGTLKNVGQINNGAVLTKTTAGTLIMEGANTYTGGTAINGGTLQVNSAGAIGSTGTVSFGGGTLQYTTNNTTDYSNRFSTAASQAVSIDTNSQAVTFATALTSTGGSLTKSGAGTLTTTAANTYSGATTVNGGVLQVGTTATAGTAALSGAGAVTVNAGATLTGTGSVAGAVTVQGAGTNIAVLTPGDNSGATNARLNLGSSLSIGANGQLQFQLTSATYNEAGNLGGYANALAFITDGANSSQVGLWNAVPTLGNSDFINVAGGLTINTSANPGTIGTVRLINNGYTPAYGDVFNLIDWAGAMGGGFNAGTGFTSGGILGDFDLPTLSGGFAWDTSAFVQYGVVVVVPEPGRALLMLLGLMALFFRRRRRD